MDSLYQIFVRRGIPINHLFLHCPIIGLPSFFEIRWRDGPNSLGLVQVIIHSAKSCEHIPVADNGILS